MHYDDSLTGYLAKLRLSPTLVMLTCPDCPARVVGKGEIHAMDLLAIHREGTCQGLGEVNDDDGSGTACTDPPAEDVLRLTR